MNAQHATECELLVMQAIWAHPEKELSMPEILENVKEMYQKDWAPQTVSTFLRRLVKRGFVKSTRHGRTFLYTPLISLKDFREATILDSCNFWCEGDAAKMLTYLNDAKKLTADEKRAIQELLNA